MKKWMLSVVLPITGILGLWLFSGQKVNATPGPKVTVVSAILDSTNNYTADGTSATPDPGDGHRATGYALFDAANGILTLHNLDITIVKNYGIYCQNDLNVILEGNNAIHGGAPIATMGIGISCIGNIVFEEKRKWKP